MQQSDTQIEEQEQHSSEFQEETVVDSSSCDDEITMKYQRALAELENQRKRFDEEKRRLQQYSMVAAVLDLLPSVDNLQRAAHHVPESISKEPWVQGVLHIERQILDCLQRWGAEPIAVAVGDSFDSSLHEAISTTPPHDSLGEDCISQVVSVGYRMHDRVVRPTQVIVTSHN